MRPRGCPPQALTTADDLVFELHCNADCQVVNTTQLLEFMDAADDDGTIDPEEWRYIRRHVALEARWNGEALQTCKKLRRCMNELGGLVASLRARIQGMKKAAVVSGL